MKVYTIKTIISVILICFVIILTAEYNNEEEHDLLMTSAFGCEEEEALYFSCEASISHDYNDPWIVSHLDEMCRHIAWAATNDDMTKERYEELLEVIMSTTSKDSSY